MTDPADKDAEIDFRAVGFTAEAAKFPRPPLAVAMLAAFNNVSVDQLQEGQRYFPNEHMMRAWERVADTARLTIIAEFEEEIERTIKRNADLDAEIAALKAEVAELCKVLGCVNKPGVAIRFVKNLQLEVQHTYARNIEIMRMWDDASPTDLQELDRLRRGWGPSTPTERQARHADLIACMQAFSIALTDLALPEEVEITEEAQKAFDSAYDRVNAGYIAVIGLIQKMHEPIAKPDIDWENRAEAAEARVAELEAGLNEAIDSIETWAAYASGYFRDKHDLAGELAGYRALLNKDKTNG